MPITADFARTFAREWTQAWNDHDLEAILEHYAQDVEFHSPRIRVVMGRDTDRIVGKGALRTYWAKALEMSRDLFFEVEQVLTGSDALTIVYVNHRSQTVAETFVFSAEGKVRSSVACYA